MQLLFFMFIFFFFRFCLYPIDLIIQFQKHILLKKVQILSHQYLIASKIEFFIGHCNDEEPSYQTAKFTRLGYLHLLYLAFSK